MATNVGNKLYAWENDYGEVIYTNTLNIINSSSTVNNNGGTILYNKNLQEVSFVVSHTDTTVTKTNASGGAGN